MICSNTPGFPRVSQDLNEDRLWRSAHGFQSAQ